MMYEFLVGLGRAANAV